MRAACEISNINIVNLFRVFSKKENAETQPQTTNKSKADKKKSVPIEPQYLRLMEQFEQTV